MHQAVERAGFRLRFGVQTFECQYARAINNPCKGSLTHAIAAEVPMAAPLVCAAYIFAGNTAINSRIKPHPAKNLDFSKRSIDPKIISITPLK